MGKMIVHVHFFIFSAEPGKLCFQKVRCILANQFWKQTITINVPFHLNLP